jgi:hypothetical protein
LARMTNDGPPGFEEKLAARKRDAECFRKAEARGELTFTVTERDPTSPKTILFWIMENFETAPAEKLRDAFEGALGMQFSQIQKKRAD